MKATVVYARVSSDEQRESGTIETQLGVVRKWCADKKIAAEEFTDDGVPGTIPFEERPAGARLMAAAKAGKIETVVIYRIDRLGRKTMVTLDVIAQLEALGVAIQSATEPFDTSTPGGRFMIEIMASQAQHENAVRRERTKSGLYRAAREGKWTTGDPPFGYLVVDRKLVLDEAPIPGVGMSRADAAKMIFKEINLGTTSVALADRLATLGVTNRKGRHLQHDTIRKIVRNPVYKGTRTYGTGKDKVVVTAPRIVSDENWLRASEGLTRNMKLSKRNGKAFYLLRGLARCAECGRTYCGNVQSGVTYYTCNGRITGRRGTGCKAKAVKAADLEGAVWGEIEDFLRNPKTVLAEVTAAMAAAEGNAASVESRFAAAKKALAAKTDEKARAYTAFRKGMVSERQFEKEAATIDAESKTLEQEIERLGDAAGRAKEREAQVADAARVLKDLGGKAGRGPRTLEAKRRVVVRLVAEIRLETVGAGADRHVRAGVTYLFGPTAPRTPRTSRWRCR